MASRAQQGATGAHPGTTGCARLVARHRLSTRLWHWTNVFAVFTLLMSGLMIFNAHPRLYWGSYGANYDPAWLEIDDREAPGGGVEGYARIGALEIGTTGVLGVFVKDGEIHRRAFPHWMTLPAAYSLVEGRRYHFLAAWVLVIAGVLYLLWSLANRHIARDLLPRRDELSPRHLWHDIRSHARLRFPKGEAAARYNVLQKISYLAVLFVLLPLMVLSGLGMSPMMNASWGWILDLFGGRQSARSVHFIAALLLVGFILVHLAMVVLAGPVNELRSMIFGKSRIADQAA